MFRSSLPLPPRSRYDPIRPACSDEQWLEYALLTCTDDEWHDVVDEIARFEPKQDGPASTGYAETDNLDRQMYEKYVAKRNLEAKRE